MPLSDAITDRLESKREALRARQAQLEQIERKISELKIEIATWEDALQLVTTNLADARPSEYPAIRERAGSVKAALKNLADAAVAVTRDNDSRRGPKGVWRSVMPEVLRHYPNAVFGLADVIAAGDLIGAPVHPDTTRSQMANYVNSGYLERVSKGKFRFTTEGREVFSELSVKPGAAQPPEKETPAQVDVPEAGVVG